MNDQIESCPIITPSKREVNLVLTESDIQRFWRKVNKTSDTGCWLWTFPPDPFGYGELRVAKKNYRGAITSILHRRSWKHLP